MKNLLKNLTQEEAGILLEVAYQSLCRPGVDAREILDISDEVCENLLSKLKASLEEPRAEEEMPVVVRLQRSDTVEAVSLFTGRLTEKEYKDLLEKDEIPARFWDTALHHVAEETVVATTIESFSRIDNKKPGEPDVFSVYVGNIGRVYEGDSKNEAIESFFDWMNLSKRGYGRASGEEVVCVDSMGNIVEAHYPELDDILRGE